MAPVARIALSRHARSDDALSPPRWSTAYCGGAWVVERYADVAQALRDPRYSVARAGRWVNSSVVTADTDGDHLLRKRRWNPTKDADTETHDDRQENTHRAPVGNTSDLRELKRILSRSLLFIDGRAHRRLRQILTDGFHAQVLEQRAPGIERIVGDLVSKIQSRAQCDGKGYRRVDFDFIHDFARPLPALVIADMMGIAPSMQARFLVAASAIAAFIGAPTPSLAQAFAAQHAVLEMRDHFAELLACPERLPPDSLTQRLFQQQCAGWQTPLETLAQCCTLLFAGYETTRHLLGNGMRALLHHPAQWQTLQRNPTGLPLALREMLRYDSPIRYTGRRLREDVCLHGQVMRQGQLVILDIAAANHDPAQFSQPEQLQLDRDEGNHLAFGRGPHVCIGAALTYMEAEIAFRAIGQHLPNLQRAPVATHSPPVRRLDGAYHGLDTLPVSCRWPIHLGSVTHPCPSR